MRNIDVRMVMAAFSFLLFAACSQTDKKGVEANDHGIRLRDFRGKELYFEQPPKRIVCLIESALSGLYMLGADSLIVGVPASVYQEPLFSHYAQIDNRIGQHLLPAPGNWDYISLESVLALRPDLVIIWAEQEEAIENLEKSGIPVYGVILHSFQDVHREISDLGQLCEQGERAEQLIAFTEKEAALLKTKFSGKTSKSAYFMWAQGLLETSGQKSTVTELFSMAGLNNICKQKEEHLILGKEVLLMTDPEIIIMWYNQKLGPEDIIEDPSLASMQAVKNKRVYELPSAFYCDFWTLKYVYAARVIAKDAYPEVFISEQNEEFMLDSLYGRKINASAPN